MCSWIKCLIYALIIGYKICICKHWIHLRKNSFIVLEGIPTFCCFEDVISSNTSCTCIHTSWQPLSKFDCMMFPDKLLLLSYPVPSVLFSQLCYLVKTSVFIASLALKPEDSLAYIRLSLGSLGLVSHGLIYILTRHSFFFFFFFKVYLAHGFKISIIPNKDNKW